jgi:soluble cytochrome b562
MLVAALLSTPMCLFFGAVARAEEEKKVKSELHKKMELMDEGMKKLKRTLRKADQNDVSLKTIGQIIELATTCRDMTPSEAAKMDEAKRKTFLEQYRAAMGKVITTMEEMKKAVAAGDLDKAKELRTALKDMEEDGHDKFMASDDRDAAKAKDKDAK